MENIDPELKGDDKESKDYITKLFDIRDIFDQIYTFLDAKSQINLVKTNRQNAFWGIYNVIMHMVTPPPLAIECVL